MILVVNCGSSSLKYQVFRMSDETSIAEGVCDRVGITSNGPAQLKHVAGDKTFKLQADMPDHGAALKLVFEALTDPEHGVMSDPSGIAAVGHRVVHGGADITESVLIGPEVIDIIKQMFVLAPVHNPANLNGIEACSELLPGTPQVAVFDTAFHQTMPPSSYLYGLPYEMYEEHRIRRYGFHGTSHRYVSMIASQMLAEGGIDAADQRIITCHLGNGCSMAAIKGGQVVDTSMGMTPLEGLLMGTRCGDLDPAVVIYLADKLGFSPQQMDSYMNKQSGLLGVSGVSSDMRDVRAAAAAGNNRAQYALEIFRYRIRKYIGAYAAALRGVDAVVFTAGIGENEPHSRAESVEGLEYLGLKIDPKKNEVPKRRDVPGWDIGEDGAAGRLLVIPTDEELMIARDTMALVGKA